MNSLSLILDSKIYKDPRLKKSLGLLRSWMGPDRARRPENYLNQEPYLNAYLSYYLPLHLPELFWVLDQGLKRSLTLSPTRVLDVGAGPGTLSLSLLFWLQKMQLKMPEEITLWDQSERALKYAKEKLRFLSLNSRIQFEKLHLPRVPQGKSFDLILMGHVLNEWGSGPRVRSKKYDLIKKISQLLSPGGSLIILEPPLREPTLDLMSLRDLLVEDNFNVIAPCPQSTMECPLLKQKLGWCYAQPSRSLFKEIGFTQFDSKIEKLLNIQLTQLSFSYLWITREKSDLSSVSVSVTDQKAPRKLLCKTNGKIMDSKKILHRGEIVLSEP